MAEGEYFLLRVERPTGATLSDVAIYIENSVAGSRGGLHPSDPMFNLEGDVVAKHLTFKEIEKIYLAWRKEIEHG